MTRESLLGRQELYQLSYSRMFEAILDKDNPLVKKSGCRGTEGHLSALE